MTADASTQAAHRAIEAVWRLESARIIAGLTGLLRDVGLAEELAQDALVAALEQWPADGIPANPGGWLMLTSRHRAIDLIRRNERLADKLNLLGREVGEAGVVAASGGNHGAAVAFAARTVERITFAVGADPDRMSWAIDLARTSMRAASRRPSSIRCQTP